MRKVLILLSLILLSISAFAVTVDETLGPVPEKRLMTSVEIKPEFFIIDSGIPYGDYCKNSIDLFKKYGVNPVWSANVDNYKDVSFFKTIRELETPLFVSSYGKDFKDYLKEKDALDYTWGDLNINRHCSLANSHYLSVSHLHAKDLWNNYLKSTFYNGARGYIYPQVGISSDFGRGSLGYNPGAIAAYRQDLMGKDEGVLCNINGQRMTVKFKDYVTYYLGFYPDPSAFGLKSFEDYYPTRKALYDPEGYKEYNIDIDNAPKFYADIDAKTKNDYIPEFLLRDMLIHYENLKFIDELSVYSKVYGGAYLPTFIEEDMANGNDLFFISSLVNLQGLIKEYTQSPQYYDAAYTKMNYLTSNGRNILNKRIGFSLEAGASNESIPYYDNYVAYIQAYEGQLLNNATVCEGKYWPYGNPEVSFADYSKDSLVSQRMKNVISFANGFKYGLKDGAKRVSPDFTTVVSRRIFRPWGKEYKPYTTTFGDPNKEIGPEKLLFDNGYVFNTVGFENAEKLEGEIVLWNVNTSPVEKFSSYLKRIKDGYINVGVTVAEALDNVIDVNMKVVSLSSYFPEFKRELVMGAEEGTLPVKVRGEDYEISGNVYKMDTKVAFSSDDGVPLVYKYNYGKQVLYVVAFNPGLEANKPLTKFVYSMILNRSSVFVHYESIDDSSVTTYKDSKGLIVRLRNKSLNENNWGSFYATDTPKCAYEIGEPTMAKIRLEKENTPYYIYNYFDGEEEQVTSDPEGFINIKSEDKTLSIFFIREKQDPKLVEDLKLRREEFTKSLNLEL